MSADAAVVAQPKKSSLFHRLYYGETKFDFVRRRRTWFAISSAIIVIGIISLAVRGLNFSIDFVGGTSWQVPANGVSVQQAQDTMNSLNYPGATVTVLGAGKNAKLNVQAKLGGVHGTSQVSFNQAVKVSDALAALTHTTTNNVSISQVGPTWGSQITHKAIEALIVFLIVIAAYISLFFEWKMALAAIIAVAHDVVLTVGIYSIFGFLVTPDTVVAFLTVLGYSLYDTIVVFDRIRDNSRGLGATGKLTYTDVVNLSMNQTLARSINTSLVAILPILAVLVLGAQILGATTLQYFGLALFVGLTSGAYSSIFIASPLVAMMKEREPRYRQIHDRLAARGTQAQLLTPAAVAAGALSASDDAPAQKRGRKTAAARSGPIRPAATATAVADKVATDDDDGESTPDAATPTNGAAKASSTTSAGRPGANAQKRPPPRPRKKNKRR